MKNQNYIDKKAMLQIQNKQYKLMYKKINQKMKLMKMRPGHSLFTK